MNGQKFSLSFSKKIEKKSLQPSALRSEGKAEVKQTAQALLAVDQDSLKVNENVEEEELVIPLLEAKRSAVLSRLARLQQEDGGKGTEEQKSEEKEASQQAVEDTKSLTLEEKAERALLEESRRKLDEWTTRDVKKDITIPANLGDDPLSAPLVDIGKESSLDDYDEIGVESFGAAILRGMGWKKSEGIGGRGKRVIEIIDPASRTLGSSEGKEGTGKKKEGDEGEEDEEELPIIKGSYVFLHSGRHRGTYGVVEVVDEDHLLIRASMTQAMVREVEGNLRAATQKEFRESSRVINKEMYDKFKEAEAKKNSEARKKTNRDEDREGSGSDRDRKTSQKTKNRDREEYHRDPSSGDTSQRSRNSESGKAKQESVEEERNRKPMEKATERQRDKSERLRDDIEERPREKNSERHRDKSERLRDDIEERSRERNSERQRDKSERLRDDIEERPREKNSERQRDRDDERQRRHREKEAERKYKESKQEYTREERKDKSRDHREDDRRTQDPHIKHHKDLQVKRKQEELTEAQNKSKTKQQRVIAPPWVRENLRVRIINKTYKGGKYHKEKVVVVSVVTAESCDCVAESGRLLGGVDPAWLETVIPKQPPMVVMVVRGQHNGHKGRILQLHKEQEKASIQLLDDETTILKLHYDDICEYVLR